MFLFLCPFSCQFFPPEYEDGWYASDAFEIDDYAHLVKKDGEDFRILQLTDTHLNMNLDTVEKTCGIIIDAVNDTHPDLLVLTGDNVWNWHNYALGARLAAFLDTFRTPYAIVMGNHDWEGVFISNEKMGEVYAKGRYSLFSPGPPNIPGCGNYGVNIVDESGEVVYALIMLDSGRYRGSFPDYGYDYISTEQIAWYEWYVKGVSKSRYGDYFPPEHVVKSMAFFHIPLPEINEVREKLEAEDPAAAADAFRDKPTPSRKNTGMFQKMKELRSTTHMFFGHDHGNMLDYEYEGVHFVYSLRTSGEQERAGTTVITIKNDLTVTVEFKQTAR
ncbi:MAG: metallophosphoesterase [Treponematales bacterium]